MPALRQQDNTARESNCKTLGQRQEKYVQKISYKLPRYVARLQRMKGAEVINGSATSLGNVKSMCVPLTWQRTRGLILIRSSPSYLVKTPTRRSHLLGKLMASVPNCRANLLVVNYIKLKICLEYLEEYLSSTVNL